MAEITTITPVYHNINLGFDTEDVKRVSIAQDSDKTHILVIRVYTNNDQMQLSSSWQYHITMRKPDGKLVVNTENIEVRNNVIYVTCTAQMLSAPGTSNCQLVIYNNSQSLYSNNFYIYVGEDMVSGDDVISTNEFNSLVSVLRQIQQYKDSAETSAGDASSSATAAENSKELAENYAQQIHDILDSLEGYDEQIDSLVSELESKSAEIDSLKRQINNSADSVNDLIAQLNSMGVDQLNEIITNAQNLSDDLLDICSAANQKSSEIDESYAYITATRTELESKLSDMNSRYDNFDQNMNNLENLLEDVSSMYDVAAAAMNEINETKIAIAREKQQADSDAASIATMQAQIATYLESLEDLATNSSGFDPIIVDSIQPSADKQEKDDMWLEPYN